MDELATFATDDMHFRLSEGVSIPAHLKGVVPVGLELLSRGIFYNLLHFFNYYWDPDVTPEPIVVAMGPISSLTLEALLQLFPSLRIHTFENKINLAHPALTVHSEEFRAAAYTGAILLDYRGSDASVGTVADMAPMAAWIRFSPTEPAGSSKYINFFPGVLAKAVWGDCSSYTSYLMAKEPMGAKLPTAPTEAKTLRAPPKMQEIDVMRYRQLYDYQCLVSRDEKYANVLASPGEALVPYSSASATSADKIFSSLTFDNAFENMALKDYVTKINWPLTMVPKLREYLGKHFAQAPEAKLAVASKAVRPGKNEGLTAFWDKVISLDPPIVKFPGKQGSARLNVDTIVDATAHNGVESFLAADFFPAARVTAIEKDVTAYNSMTANLRQQPQRIRDAVVPMNGDPAQIIPTLSGIDLILVDPHVDDIKVNPESKTKELYLSGRPLVNLLEVWAKRAQVVLLRLPPNYDIVALRERLRSKGLFLNGMHKAGAWPVPQGKPDYLMVAIVVAGRRR